ncbi:MAG: AAA family ATPase, partial [Gemmatimonadetes bacterium]|nr:AAA family ATPase [Gemmatimonadota bacterium]
VIIMTSNMGSHFILESSGSMEWEEIDKTVRGEMRNQFRPEFLNRVDDTILFRPLDAGHLRKIVDLQLERVHELVAETGLTLEVTEEARVLLAREGFEPAFGARPVKRAIQRLVQDPLALFVLEQTLPEGTLVRVVVGEGGDGLAFEVENPSV